jgi:hypothetical protein
LHEDDNFTISRSVSDASRIVERIFLFLIVANSWKDEERTKIDKRTRKKQEIGGILF